MRKKSKKRVPQDIQAWVRVRAVDHDVLTIPGKKNSRWVAGGRRDWNTKILASARIHEMRGIVVESIRNSLTTANYSFAQLAMQKIANRVHGNKIISLSRYKNFCVFSGRSRTYNRSLYMARHNMRKFVGAGLISGLLK